MAMTLLTKTQRRLKILFTNHAREDGYMFDEEFRNSIEMLRELGDEIFEHTGDVMDIESLPPIVKMMRRYDFPSGMLRFLVVFIKENRVDFTLIDSSMFVVSEMDATATGSDVSMEINYRRYIDISTVQNRYKHRPELKLVISPNASLNEIKDFIDQNWSTFIKPKTTGAKVGRTQR
jgi:hypothetical protein